MQPFFFLLGNVIILRGRSDWNFQVKVVIANGPIMSFLIIVQQPCNDDNNSMLLIMMLMKGRG